jgi:hypothetical protein
MDGIELVNWNHSARSHPAKAITPASAQEIAAIVADRGLPSPVRAAGHLHSLNRCIEADGGTQLRMDRLDRVLEVDRAGGTITVQAGASLLQIAETLLPDFQLPVMPEIGNATAGSVACCGTKDSSLGPGPGQVASTVTGVKLVDGRGDLQVVTEASDAERLRLLRSSYGLLGVVVEVTFRIEPVAVLLFDYQPLGTAPLPPLDAVRGGADGFLAFFEPYEDTIIVERRTRQPASTRITAIDKLQCRLRSFLWEHGGTFLASAVARLGSSGQSFLDDSLPRILDPVRFRARRADTMIDFEGDRRHYFDFTFWAFGVSSWAAVVPAYVRFCREFTSRTGFRPSLPTEIYAIAQDAASALSVSQDEDVFTLDMVHHRAAGDPFDPLWIQMNQEFNAFAALHGGRPLLNQTKELDRSHVAEVRRRNPALDRGWRQLAGAADPRFLTPYFQRLLE